MNYSPVGKFVWNFASRGLTSVGQDEIVILLEVEEEETLPPRDIFTLIQSIYEQVEHGSGRPPKTYRIRMTLSQPSLATLMACTKCS